MSKVVCAMVVVKKRQMKQEETVGRSLIIADALQWRGGSNMQSATRLHENRRRYSRIARVGL